MMKVILALMALVAVAVAVTCPATCQGPACWDESEPGFINGTCGDRYYGIPKRICFDNGNWHDNTQVFCTLYLCPAGVFDNANYTTTTANNTKTGTCIEGYWKGAPRRYCDNFGVWATPFATPCVPKPKCGTMEAGNADFSITVSNATSVAGTCKPGYTGTPPTQDCIDGNWSNLVGSCTRIQCAASSLDSATWAARDAPLTGTDSVVGTCDGVLSGAPTRDCNSDGSWSGVTGGTPCTASCGQTTSYAHATFPPTPAGQTATGTCDSGYAETPKATRKCLANGTWASNLDTYCVRNFCEISTDNVGGATYARTTSATFRNGVCLNGFTGRASRYCQPDGQWASNAYISCTPV